LHKQEITEKRQQEVFEDNEKKLTAEFKLAKPGDEELNEMQGKEFFGTFSIIPHSWK
jgi:hypothetical protein